MNSIHTQIMNKISQTTLNSDKFIAFVVSPEGKSFLGSISASTDAITALQQPHSTPFTSREIRTPDQFSRFLSTYLPTHKSSYNSVYLEIRPAPLTAGFGLFATCLIPPSTVLLNIHPKAMIFTQSAAYPDLSDTLKVHPQSALAFHLTLERLKYSNSTHCLYLDTLPSHTDFSDLLMNWSDESLQTSFLNNGTPGNKGMFERGLKSRLTLIGDYCYYYKLLTDRSEFLVGVEGGVRSFTLEVFKWAMGVVLTRQNNLVVNSSRQLVLCPLWDMLNHSDFLHLEFHPQTDEIDFLPSKVCSTHQTTSFNLVCTTPATSTYTPDEEILMRYSPHRSNQEYFASNGFVRSAPAHSATKYFVHDNDSAVLRLGLAGGNRFRRIVMGNVGGVVLEETGGDLAAGVCQVAKNIVTKEMVDNFTIFALPLSLKLILDCTFASKEELQQVLRARLGNDAARIGGEDWDLEKQLFMLKYLRASLNMQLECYEKQRVEFKGGENDNVERLFRAEMSVLTGLKVLITYTFNNIQIGGAEMVEALGEAGKTALREDFEIWQERGEVVGWGEGKEEDDRNIFITVFIRVAQKKLRVGEDLFEPGLVQLGASEAIVMKTAYKFCHKIE
ncbi:hypothetical protein ScalyP_jg1043 [Parmales sp. scaly parma]|nr:hypothetical protein ScalyP_jg1043 [Parmales sp. scaly parma]